MFTPPTARYLDDGDLDITFPGPIRDDPTFPLVRLALLGDTDPLACAWYPGGERLLVGWHVARAVEQRLRAMWPDVAIANPLHETVGIGPRRIAALVGTVAR